MLVRAFYEITIVYNKKNSDDIPASYIKERLQRKPLLMDGVIVEDVEWKGEDELEPLSGDEDAQEKEES